MELGKSETTILEIKTFVGIYFLMILHSQYSTKEFFEVDDNSKKRKQDEFWNPPSADSTCPRGNFNESNNAFVLQRMIPPLTKTMHG